MIPGIAFASLAATALALTFGLGGCASSSGTTGQTASVREKSGQQLWADNCSRCHNTRPPEEFSDAQWSAIVMHMRLRADLTGDEQRKVTEFLQASN